MTDLQNYSINGYHVNIHAYMDTH